MRYRFYREHKFVSAAMNDFERKLATFDVGDRKMLIDVRDSFASLKTMLQQHAAYENERVHRLLVLKQSPSALPIETDHVKQEHDLEIIAQKIDELFELHADEQIEKNYDLYLSYRQFVAEMLCHLNEEETVLLPELQRLYTDRELASVAEIAYRQMEPNHIVDMVHGLFPYMNKYDRLAFLNTIQMLVPEKFIVAWPLIKEDMPENERDFKAGA